MAQVDDGLLTEKVMGITIDLPHAVVQEAQNYASLEGSSVEKMLTDCLNAELKRRRLMAQFKREHEAASVSQYLWEQSDWLNEDFVFNREEANEK